VSIPSSFLTQVRVTLIQRIKEQLYPTDGSASKVDLSPPYLRTTRFHGKGVTIYVHAYHTRHHRQQHSDTQDQTYGEEKEDRHTTHGHPAHIASRLTIHIRPEIDSVHKDSEDIPLRNGKSPRYT